MERFVLQLIFRAVLLPSSLSVTHVCFALLHNSAYSRKLLIPFRRKIKGRTMDKATFEEAKAEPLLQRDALLCVALALDESLGSFITQLHMC